MILKILLVAIIIAIFWLIVFLVSVQHPTNKVNIMFNLTDIECFKMGCSYQPKPYNNSICVCLIK
jgi:uncharacterized membrane protein